MIYNNNKSIFVGEIAQQAMNFGQFHEIAQKSLLVVQFHKQNAFNIIII